MESYIEYLLRPCNKYFVDSNCIIVNDSARTEIFKGQMHVGERATPTWAGSFK
ncbi:MAG: hypothetical protein WBQ38_00825 [Ignavibacteria bacterium]